jgi:hypothetical protein
LDASRAGSVRCRVTRLAVAILLDATVRSARAGSRGPQSDDLRSRPCLRFPGCAPWAAPRATRQVVARCLWRPRVRAALHGAPVRRSASAILLAGVLAPVGCRRPPPRSGARAGSSAAVVAAQRVLAVRSRRRHRPPGPGDRHAAGRARGAVDPSAVSAGRTPRGRFAPGRTGNAGWRPTSLSALRRGSGGARILGGGQASKRHVVNALAFGARVNREIGAHGEMPTGVTIVFRSNVDPLALRAPSLGGGTSRSDERAPATSGPAGRELRPPRAIAAWRSTGQGSGG